MSHHPRRTEILRLVALRLDEATGDLLAVALESPGVLDTFTDEADLVGALLLRWHTRLTAELDQALGHDPRDAALATEQGWARTAEAMPGTRRLLDQLLAAAPSARVERLVARAAATEQARLASAAGLGGDADPVRAGRALQVRARGRVAQDADERERARRLSARAEAVRHAAEAAPAPAPGAAAGASARFVARLRALVAA